MKQYLYKPTRLMAECFEENGIPFKTHKRAEKEGLMCLLVIQGANRSIPVWFISRDNKNSVAVRVFGLIVRTPASKHIKMLRICNSLSRDNRFIKYVIDDDGDIHMEYDLLEEISDDALGLAALKAYSRFKLFLDRDYKIIKEALRTDEDSTFQVSSPSEYLN